MFSQFTSLRELKLFMCFFPSFCTFRRVLVSLPALKSLICSQVDWPIPTQPSILSIRSTGWQPALQTLRIPFFLPTPMLALLEWLVRTRTRSTLVDWELDYPFMALHLQTTLPGGPTLDHFAQILAPSIHRASLGGTQRTKILHLRSPCPASSTYASSASKSMRLSNWPGVADFLRPLPARLDTLIIDVFYSDVVMDSDQVVKEDGDSRKASMTTNGLELLDSVLSRDNFKDMRLLTFKLWVYWDRLSRLRESTLEEVQRKLPTLHSRATLNIQLDLFD
ncbi:hypothetical protein LXA43DRAFT_516581 [Ganoderma leucocontextum]|nr:hypothetical protein LXA43DRAFT_516581 [Ganoderma leucocontextum]